MIFDPKLQELCATRLDLIRRIRTLEKEIIDPIRERVRELDLEIRRIHFEQQRQALRQEREK